LRIGLIGLGRIGAFHAETLTGIDGVDLVVTDARPELTEAVAVKLGVDSAASPADLLGARLDGVVIAAATDAHPQLILAAIEAGLPVFCEKPVARAPEEAAEVLRRCAGARVQIGYNRRFDPGFVAAREAVQRGELGQIHTVRSTTLDPAPPPLAYVAVSGGIFHDCSVHDFDIIRFVTGREVVEVYATGSTYGFPDIDDVSSSWSSRTAGTTRAATTYGWSCTAPRTASRSAWRTGCRCARSNPACDSRPVRRTSSSWTGLPPRTDGSLSPSPNWWPASERARARSPTRSRRAGSPRPAPGPGTNTVPYE
jgi:predicted dehydrogenase